MIELLEQYGRLLLVGHYPNGPLGGLAMTILTSLLCLAICFPIATLLALARTHGNKTLARFYTGYIYFVRSMPLLMLIFWIYYFLPYVLPFSLSPFVTIVLAITIFSSAYLAEVIRAAIEALPKGQYDAASALGFRYWQTTFLIVLPQALTNCIPGLVSQFILIIKETSLGYIITFNELTYVAHELNKILLVKPVEIFTILAISYFVLCSGLSQLGGQLERRIARGRLSNDSDQ